VRKSLRPQSRPAPEAPVLVAVKDDIERALLAAQQVADTETEVIPAGSVATAAAKVTADVRPEPRPENPENIVLASAPSSDPIQEVVMRVSTSGGRHWGINVGRYPSQYKARQILLKTALSEMSTLDGSLRKVIKRPTGFDANFMGLTRESADLACRRLQAKKITCFMIGPG
jgi:D-alanyl-D-alanine carboxypeptidase